VKGETVKVGKQLISVLNFLRFGRFGRWKDFDCFTKGLATSPPMAGTTNMESELWR